MKCKGFYFAVKAAISSFTVLNVCLCLMSVSLCVCVCACISVFICKQTIENRPPNRMKIGTFLKPNTGNKNKSLCVYYTILVYFLIFLLLFDCFCMFRLFLFVRKIYVGYARLHMHDLSVYVYAYVVYIFVSSSANVIVALLTYIYGVRVYSHMLLYGSITQRPHFHVSISIIPYFFLYFIS